MLAGGLHSSQEEGLWSTYHHQEFAPPSLFDIDAILRKARDHLNMLVDEIELLQTSPEHMRQYVLEEKANTGFNSNDNQTAAEKWEHIAQTLAAAWTHDIQRWKRLVLECEHLKATLAEHKVVTSSEARLTGDVAIAMRSFGHAVHGTLGPASFDWQSRIRSINVMQKLSKRPRLMAAGVYTDSSRYLDPEQQSDRIFRWAENMAAAICDMKPGGVAWFVRKLRGELEGAVYNRGMENWLSGIALMDEFALLWSCRQLIDCCDTSTIQPGVQARDMLPPTFELFSKKTVEALSGGTSFPESGKLLRRFCEIPHPKGLKNLLRLEKMTLARESLTDVWNAIRDSWNERERRIERSEEFRAAILSHISFDISPEHLARVEAERRQIEDEDRISKTLSKRQEQDVVYSQQSWDLGTDSDGAVRKKLTEKVRTLHVDATVKVGLDELTLSDKSSTEDSDADLVAAPLRIAVKRDSLSVISKLFPTGADGSDGVRWTQLVQALTDAGMAVTQGVGSSVSFANERGSISLHKPHPDPIVDAIRLRAFGRRLRKWFGWTHNTFVLREKGDEKRGAEDAFV